MVTVVTVVFKGFFRIFLPHFTTFTTLQITTKRVHGLYFFKFDLVVKIPYISFMGNKTKLTARQKEFAKHYVEGIYSARQCAIKSGYSEDSAKFHASRLLIIQL